MSEFDNEFPGNSQKPKEPKPALEEKKVESVVVGKVVRKKEGLGSKFRKTFLAGDPTAVRNYVIMEVVIPGVRDMVTEAITQYVDRYINGDSRSGVRRGYRAAPSTTPNYVNYSRYSAARKPGAEAPRAGGLSAQDRATHNFDEIVMDTRVEAEVVRDKLYDLIQRYEFATVSDYYKLVGETPNYTDERHGWSDISQAEVIRVRGGGFMLSLPKPGPISDL